MSLSACKVLEPLGFYNDIYRNSVESGVWRRIEHVSTNLPAASLVKSVNNSAKVVVFIEGDGNAWVNKTTRSDNPTPNDPVSLKMALKDESENAIYLGRPCQYVDDSLAVCDNKYWTTHRYSSEVIDQMSDNLDAALKMGFPAQPKLTLVGYSGGGVIATLLASKRNDVAEIITLASNLDTDAWIRYHRVTPLENVNPVDVATRLGSVSQVHFTGKLDTVVPYAVVESFVLASGNEPTETIIQLDGYNHSCCWARDWQQLKGRAVRKLQN